MNWDHGPWANCFRLLFSYRQSKTSPQGLLQGRRPDAAHERLSCARMALVCALLAIVAGIGANRACGAGTLSFSPAAANFGNVTVGTSKSISVTVTNTGTASVAFSQESLQANMYTVSGFTLPLTLAPGAHFTLTVKFAPLETGTIGGRIVFGSNATNSLVYYGL